MSGIAGNPDLSHFIGKLVWLVLPRTLLWYRLYNNPLLIRHKHLRAQLWNKVGICLRRIFLLNI